MSNVVSFSAKRAVAHTDVHPDVSDMDRFLGHFLQVDDISADTLIVDATPTTECAPAPTKRVTMQTRSLSLDISLGRDDAS